MTLEDLIYTQLSQADGLGEKLAQRGGIPAIFYQDAPGMQDALWQDTYLPHIYFTAALRADAERQTAGVLKVHIVCGQAGTDAGMLERAVKNALEDLFLTPENEPPYCLAWAGSGPLDMMKGEAADTSANGVSVCFDIYAFPAQDAADPDPVAAVNSFLCAWDDAAKVIGTAEYPRVFKPTEQSPVYYARMTEWELQRETNTVAWIDGVVVLHVFAPGAEARLKKLRELEHALSLMGEVSMPDSSPMFLRQIKADSSRGHLAPGQIRLSVRFGILRDGLPGQKVNNITFSRGKDRNE